MKQSRGITLIALVITIIVMLILAGVSLNAVVGDNGVITNAMKATIAQKEAEVREKAELAILDINIEYIEKGKPADTLEDYIRDKIDKTEDGILKLPNEDEIYINEDDKLVYRDEDGNEAILKTDENGNLVVDEIILNDGTDNKAPVIVEVKTTSSSITFTATDRVGIIGYAITETDEEPQDWREVTSTKELTQTESGLTQGNTYYIWVKDEAGNVSEYKKVKAIVEEALTNANTTFTYNPEGWVNGGTITVTASSSLATGEFTLQTSKDAIEWSDTATQSFTANGTMYARLVDSEKQAGTGYATANVDRFDTTKPIVTEATATTNSITFTATDEASGIIGYTVTESTAEPTSFTNCENIKTLSTTVAGKAQGTTYYIWVKDEAGNVSNYKEITTSTVTGATESNLQVSSTTWSGINATVTFTTTTNYTIQLSTDNSTWNTQSSITVATGTTIYARLVDNANQAGTSYITATPVLTYTIVYDGNGSDEGSTSSSIHSYGTEKELTENGYTKEGYIFQGWATSASGTVVYTDKQSVSNLASTNGATVTLYAVWAEATLSTQITSTNYGDYVNYSKDLGLTLKLEGESTTPKTDWRIFYEDTEQDRIYLIAADYVPSTSSLLKLSSAGMTPYSVYAFYWNSVPNSLSEVSRQDSIFGITTNSYTLNASNTNSRCVSTLLDTDHWSNFVDTTVADYAIGGPTIEMYTNSWNEKKYTTLIPTSESTASGYKINGADSLTMSGNSGHKDNLYYPHMSSYSNCAGYWLAAPSAKASDLLFSVDGNGYLYAMIPSQIQYGVRPVVALKSGIKATKDAETGIWQLGE